MAMFLPFMLGTHSLKVETWKRVTGFKGSCALGFSFATLIGEFISLQREGKETEQNVRNLLQDHPKCVNEAVLFLPQQDMLLFQIPNKDSCLLLGTATQNKRPFTKEPWHMVTKPT